MMVQGRQWSASAELNVTPLIDVLLVLLVIFMLTVQVRQAMLVQLAEKAAAGPEVMAKPVVLDLADDGRYLLNRIEVREADLGPRLRHVYAGRDEKILFVRTGPRRTYQELVTAMDVARGAGVEVIGYAP